MLLTLVFNSNCSQSSEYCCLVCLYTWCFVNTAKELRAYSFESSVQVYFYIRKCCLEIFYVICSCHISEKTIKKDTLQSEHPFPLAECKSCVVAHAGSSLLYADLQGLQNAVEFMSIYMTTALLFLSCYIFLFLFAFAHCHTPSCCFTFLSIFHT